jgi:hypothetical protein
MSMNRLGCETVRVQGQAAVACRRASGLSGVAARVAAVVTALSGSATLAQVAARPTISADLASVTTTSVISRGRSSPAQTQVFMGNAPSVFPQVPAGIANRECGAVVTSVANNFNGIALNSPITLQLGFRQNEAFGASYTFPADAFPIEINLIEQFVGTIASTQGGAPTISCGWRMDIYDGIPGASGVTLQFSVVSDPDPTSSGLPGDIVIDRVGPACSPSGPIGGGAAPSASAGKLQFSVDQTADPVDRMIFSNLSGTNTVTVMFTITRMNSPNPNPCAILGGEEPRCENIFPATEANNTNTLNFPTRNFLFAIDCPSNPFAAPGGLYSFASLPQSVRPTTDILQQITYTPTVCTTISGACCNAATGTCTLTASGSCSGNYLGDNTMCMPTNPCPQPTGACCLPLGTCEIRTSALCTGTGTIFRGANTACASANCPEPVGACCAGASCAAGLSLSTCTTLGGEFIGSGSVCGPAGACPRGACCLPTGTCAAPLSSPACVQQGGTFQGVDTTCGTTSCPQPSGACCTTAGDCVGITLATCTVFGGSWQGAFTTCTPSPCAGSTGFCCRGAICQAGVQSGQCTGPNTFYIASAATTCGTSVTTPCCRADFNKLGGLSTQDIFDFLSAWFANSLEADISGNGLTTLDTGDIFSFLAAWFAGC